MEKLDSSHRLLTIKHLYQVEHLTLQQVADGQASPDRLYTTCCVGMALSGDRGNPNFGRLNVRSFTGFM